MVISTRRARAGRVAALAVLMALAWGCAAGGGAALAPSTFDYFATPAPDDPWARKIRRWQMRERFDDAADPAGGPAAVAGSAADAGETGDRADAAVDLAVKFQSFRAERKRALARDVAGWIQEQARDHYVPDGPIDRWATFAETLERNGDDCDGLELLTLHMLRDLGFASNEVYRAIVFRRSDGQHHMVTLWFEDPEDPWVIDPTGAMTSGMPRMSKVPGWEAIKVFSEAEDFSVKPHFAATR